jgi:hypothetical protein
METNEGTVTTVNSTPVEQVNAIAGYQKVTEPIQFDPQGSLPSAADLDAVAEESYVAAATSTVTRE